MAIDPNFKVESLPIRWENIRPFKGSQEEFFFGSEGVVPEPHSVVPLSVPLEGWKDAHFPVDEGELRAEPGFEYLIKHSGQEVADACNKFNRRSRVELDILYGVKVPPHHDQCRNIIVPINKAGAPFVGKQDPFWPEPLPEPVYFK